MEKIKIGILGLGHLGKIHLKCMKETPFEIVGFYDPDPTLKELPEIDIPYFESIESLLDQVDAVDIVSPTTTHYELIMQAIEKGKHVFVEKPICYLLDQVISIESAMSSGQILQVGHVERFNPAFIPLKGKQIKPHFIEGHRIATFNPRGTDVSVVLDLMIHDLDILTALVDSEVSSISATGVSIVSKSPDIANARIEFENGCVANLTASRISMKQMRKFRIFTGNSYISVDFLEKETQSVAIIDSPSDNDNALELDTYAGKKYIKIDIPEIQKNNAIKDELNAFHHSILSGESPEVGIVEARRSLDIALQIIDQIEEKERKYR